MPDEASPLVGHSTSALEALADLLHAVEEFTTAAAYKVEETFEEELLAAMDEARAALTAGHNHSPAEENR